MRSVPHLCKKKFKENLGGETERTSTQWKSIQRHVSSNSVTMLSTFSVNMLMVNFLQMVISYSSLRQMRARNKENNKWELTLKNRSHAFNGESIDVSIDVQIWERLKERDLSCKCPFLVLFSPSPFPKNLSRNENEVDQYKYETKTNLCSLLTVSWCDMPTYFCAYSPEPASKLVEQVWSFRSYISHII
jgi:hypothetical protein